MELLAEVSTSGMDNMRDVSVAASVATIVSSVSQMGTVLLIIVGLGLCLLLLAKMGGA
jgi:hypothetical protein